MSVEPIGILTILVGLLCLIIGYRASFIAFVTASVLGASAAVLIGNANIQPGHLLLGFAALAVVLQPNGLNAAVHSLKFPGAGFWLACLVAYGLVTAVFMPRLLAGSFPIIPLGTSEYADTGSTVPIGPVSSNFTQGIYFAADLLCFMLTVAVGSTTAGFRAVVTALLAYAGANAAFALIDVATYSTGTQWALEFLRNAKYTLHIEEEVGGLKRIAGSFPEASAFAGSTLGALGFTATLWIRGYRPRSTGPLAISSLALVILSTSSAGLAATPPLLLILYLTAMTRNGFTMDRPLRSALLILAPLLAIGLVLAVALNEAASGYVMDFLGTLIFNKSTSSSGIERSSWNRIAIQNFFDSAGIGVGLGTVRTSSFPVALLACVGVPGTLLYLLFFGRTFFRQKPASDPGVNDVRLACRNTCLGLLILACLVSPTIEQGLLFYVFAGLACAVPELRTASQFSQPPVLARSRA